MFGIGNSWLKPFPLPLLKLFMMFLTLCMSCKLWWLYTLIMPRKQRYHSMNNLCIDLFWTRCMTFALSLEYWFEGLGFFQCLCFVCVCVWSVCMPTWDISNTGTALMSAVLLIANRASLWDTHEMSFYAFVAQSEMFNWLAS